MTGHSEAIASDTSESDSERHGLKVVNFRCPLDKRSNRFVKRTLDVTVSLMVILFVLSWLLPLLCLIIILESSGPIFFVQQRGGKNNRTFNCIKLRTMLAHSGANTFHTAPDQRYITRLGQWLRKTNLDELPQFFNVLLGDMSLVGPRPHMLAHDSYYAKTISHYKLRQSIKPGITGWAQIHGYRGDINSQEKMERRVDFDWYYIQNQSLWLDIKVLFLTVFHRRGYVNAM